MELREYILHAIHSQYQSCLIYTTLQCTSLTCLDLKTKNQCEPLIESVGWLKIAGFTATVRATVPVNVPLISRTITIYQCRKSFTCLRLSIHACNWSRYTHWQSVRNARTNRVREKLEIFKKLQSKLSVVRDTNTKHVKLYIQD